MTGRVHLDTLSESRENGGSRQSVYMEGSLELLLEKLSFLNICLGNSKVEEDVSHVTEEQYL